MIEKGLRLKDRYRLDRPLGRGGMASVWLATDEVLERDVAVKVLSDTIASDPEFLARFRREARVAASLSHPNLIGVYDFAEGDERPYLVMEYVPGSNLAERMAEGATVDSDRLAQELLGALGHIHAAGIVHRDVKPQNVLIGPDGSAKLIDFGIALPHDATSLTRTGHLLGTARFIAPEVMEGEPATARSDLYSAGIVLRDCLGDDESTRLRRLVARMSNADPGARPASAAEALAGLGATPLVPDLPTERYEPTASYETSEATEELEREPRAETPPPAPARSTSAAGTGERTPAPQRTSGSRGKLAALAALLAALVAVGAVLALGTGGSEESPVANRDSRATGSGNEKQASAPEPEAEVEAEPEPEPEPEEEPEPEDEADEDGATAAAEGEDPALGAALNQEGFELIQAGNYEEAVPVLEEAVRSFPPGSEELDYAYALFNLGNALRLSGRPEEAIPVLEQRLEIPNQTGTVREELAAAQAEAES